MRVGFTGTRQGMTDAQKSAFGLWIYGRQLSEFHHGCCVGADDQAAFIVYDEAMGRPAIKGWPSTLESLVSNRACMLCEEIHQPQDPLVRNRSIVDACDVLVACPKGMEEERRSGTWATIRHARKCRKPIVIFWPDGTVSKEPE